MLILKAESEKTIANEATDKKLISKIYKQLLQLNSKKNKWPLIKFSLRLPKNAILVKNSSANAGDLKDVSSIPGSGRYPGEGNGPLQYSYLENPMDWGAWQATVHRVAQSWMWLKWFNIAQNDLSVYFKESESCSVVFDSLRPHGLIPCFLETDKMKVQFK